MYNEIDMLILKSIAKCSYCDNKDVKIKSFCTTIAAAYSFYDSYGVNHVHDGNKIDALIECSNGHTSKIIPLNSCWCGWEQKYAPHSKI